MKIFQFRMFYTKLHTVQCLYVVYDNIDEYIGNYDETKYLSFFHSDEKFDKIFDRIRCLITLKKQCFGRLFSKIYENQN